MAIAEMDINDGEIDMELNVVQPSIRLKGPDYMIIICLVIFIIGVTIILILMSINEINVYNRLKCYNVFINESHDYKICE